MDIIKDILRGFDKLMLGEGKGAQRLVGIAIFSVVINLISGAMQVLLDDSPLQLGLIALALLISLLILHLANQLRHSKSGLNYVTDRQKPDRYPGLILLVSKGRIDRDPMEQSAAAAIRYHLDGADGLKHCWLIATSGPQGSHQFALKLAESCREKGVEPHVENVADGFNGQETYNLVRQIYAEAHDKFGLRPDQIICDFTGGLKPMSAGMVLACADQFPMQYMYGRQPDIDSEPRQIEVRLETVSGP